MGEWRWVSGEASALDWAVLAGVFRTIATCVFYIALSGIIKLAKIHMLL